MLNHILNKNQVVMLIAKCKEEAVENLTNSETDEDLDYWLTWHKAEIMMLMNLCYESKLIFEAVEEINDLWFECTVKLQTGEIAAKVEEEAFKD